MGAIPETLVAEVVAETSERMARDASYAQMAVGSFVQAHPDVSRFVAANTDSIGGEGVIHTVFHAEVLAECFRRHVRRELPAVGFSTLDAAASQEGDAISRLASSQPALSDYVKSNVETEPVQNLLALIALAFERVAR